MSTQSRLASRGKGLCLLSLDAGGPRGISQLKILAETMHRWNFRANEDQMDRPHAVFDMIGGVGSGGFIAILLVLLKMTAEEALKELIHLTVNVLDKQGLNVQTRTTTLKEQIDKLLGKNGIDRGMRLLDCPDQSVACKLVVPISYKRHVGSYRILRNFTVRQEKALNFTIAEALLATLSTPPYFTALSIVKDAATFEYTSADWTLSNPLQEIISEAHASFGSEERVACLLSLGCGHPGVFSAPEFSNSVEWNEFLDRLATDGEQKAQNLESQMGLSGIYQRFSVTIGLDRSIGILSPGDIVTHTSVYLADIAVSRKMDVCISNLKARDGVSSLEQLKHTGHQTILSPQLPPLTKTFVMRRKPWNLIHKTILGPRDPDDIDGPRMLFVTGIGGCGKTQLMLRFMKVHEAEFACQMIIDGSSEDRIRADIIRNVRAMGNEHSQRGFEECLHFLSQAPANELRLLLYDNVDDPDIDLSALLPRGYSCAIAITSRNHLLGIHHPDVHLQLDAMSLDEAIELLLNRSGHIVINDRDRDDAASLARALGCLPIALQQARSYMQQTRCSSSAYLERLSSSRNKLLGQKTKFQTGMQSISTYAAFETSFGRLASRAQGFLWLLSYFHRNNFPLELVVLAARHQFSRYRLKYIEHGDEFYTGKNILESMFLCDGEWDVTNLDNIIASLQNYSLTTILPGVGTTLLNIHPLVHEWLQLSIPGEERADYQSAAILLLALGARNYYATSTQYLGSHVIHMSHLWNYLHVNNATAFALILRDNGIVQSALPLQERVVQELREQLDSDDIAISDSIWVLALAYGDSGRYDEAAKLQEEVLKLKERHLGKQDPETITASSDLAANYYLLGRLNEAEVIQKEVLKLRKKILGEQHYGTISASSNLALTYYNLERLEEAKVLQEHALKLSKEMFGERHPGVIDTSSTLAAIYHGLGRLNEAQVLLEDTVKLSKEILGEWHPSTLNVLSDLADTYYYLGRVEEAEVIQEEVLKLKKDALGKRHPNTIRAGMLLARIYISRGKTDAALDLLVKAEVIIAETLGVAHSLYIECQRLKAGILIAEEPNIAPLTAPGLRAKVRWYTKFTSRKYFSKSRKAHNE